MTEAFAGPETFRRIAANIETVMKGQSAAVSFTNPMVVNSDVKPGAEMGWAFFQAPARRLGG